MTRAPDLSQMNHLQKVYATLRLLHLSHNKDIKTYVHPTILPELYGDFRFFSAREVVDCLDGELERHQVYKCLSMLHKAGYILRRYLDGTKQYGARKQEYLPVDPPEDGQIPGNVRRCIWTNLERLPRVSEPEPEMPDEDTENPSPQEDVQESELVSGHIPPSVFLSHYPEQRIASIEQSLLASEQEQFSWGRLLQKSNLIRGRQPWMEQFLSILSHFDDLPEKDRARFILFFCMEIGASIGEMLVEAGDYHEMLEGVDALLVVYDTTIAWMDECANSFRELLSLPNRIAERLRGILQPPCKPTS